MAEENNLEPGQIDASTGPVEGDDEATSEERSTPAPVVTKGMTPGQRLAAKKAQKAVDKREFKEELKRKDEEAREKERSEANRIFVRSPKAEPALPEEVQKVAGDFTDFMQKNRGRILGGVAAFVGASALFLVAQRFVFTGSAEQATKLAAAFEVQAAPVDADDTDGLTDDGEPLYKTRADRTKKALEAYQAVVQADPGSVSAGWASLAEVELKVEQKQAEDAAKLAQTAYDAHKSGNPTLAARALEGLAIALEAAGKGDEATKRYEELKGFDGGAHKDLAEYHLGRLKLAAGDKDGAKALLKPLYDRLNERGEGVPPSRYLRGEVEIRLAEIDSSLVDRGAAGGGEQQFSPEELQRLIEQLRQQQGAN